MSKRSRPQVQSDQQSEEFVQSQPQRPKRKNNTDPKDKIFKCRCGKDFSSRPAWHTHFNTKHKKGDPEEAKRIREDFNELLRRLHEVADGPQVVVDELPTFEEEASQKISSDHTYIQICTAWRTLNPSSITEVIFDRLNDEIEGDIVEFSDIQRIRKELLDKAVGNLVEQYDLQDLASRATDLEEFKDYKLENEHFTGRFVLNFSWDLLKYFRPAFAGKVKVILFGLLCGGSDLNSQPGWINFRQKQWSKYSFIERILKKYHGEWQQRNHAFMRFQ